MALVATDSIAMNAGRLEPAELNYSMNDSTKCSLLTVHL
jgi:hypothetical protein